MTTIKEMWERLQERLRQQACAKRTKRELNQLTDKELHDLGITRYDIPRIAGGCKNA